MKQLIYLVCCIYFFSGCINDPQEDEKYKRPDWLAGKVYTQLKAQPELSTFTKCIELTGYDTIINTSGSYTIFAPNNEAFSLYFQNNPDYQSLEDIPKAELERIVKYHVVQNPWSKIQLRSLDIYGWIDTLDPYNNEPMGYKRETLLLEEDQFLGVTRSESGKIIIVDSLEAGWFRKISVDSRKYAPVFYKEYFNIYDLSLSDYEFYFDRTFENPGDIYYVNARIIGDEIFAENGFVYNIDRVVEPLQNAYQLLNDRNGNESYTIFLELVNLYPRFEYNHEKTMDQPGADEGVIVDSLFDLTYPELVFDVYNEKTTAPSGTMGLPSNVSIRYHHALVVPTDEAFNDFINNYLVGADKWGSLEEAPDHIKRIITRTHMSINPVYPTDFENGFYNGELDIVRLNPDAVIQKKYCSNSTFIGLNEAIVPRAFKSITGPVYLLRGYSKVMYAIEQAGLLPALKRENENYLFFVESDINTDLDSSLIYEGPGRFSTWEITERTRRRLSLTTNDLRILLMNQVGTSYPMGIAKKEFIKNLAGNYLIIDNESGIVKGTAESTQGYHGFETVDIIPSQISSDADNGITYDVDDWFNFDASSLFIKISGSYKGFHSLLQKAGLSEDKLSRYTFISENENYTVFVPNDSALIKSGVDTLNNEELTSFLMLHFIQGDLIFTDGNKSQGYYETTRIDEKSTPYTTVYTQLYIDPDYDQINIPDNTGNNYLTINESSTTNMLAGRDLGDGTEVYPNVVNNAVIHEIDKVLLYGEVDTR